MQGILHPAVARRIVAAAVLAGGLAATACDHTDDSTQQHYCEEDWKDWFWSTFNMTYDHSEPRMCPLDGVTMGMKIYSSAFIIDGGQRDFLSLQISGHTVPDGQLLNFDIHDFMDWGVPLGWAAYTGLEIPARTGTDSCRDLISIVMRETYPGTDNNLLPGGAYYITYRDTSGPCSPTGGGSGGGGGGGGGNRSPATPPILPSGS